MAMSIEPSGAFLYVTSNNSPSVSIFQINATTGVLTVQPGITTPAVPMGITTTPYVGCSSHFGTLYYRIDNSPSLALCLES